MKKIKFISNIALAGLMALGATSCEDWLTIYPQNKVVEEQFWEDKNDLEGVRYHAYVQTANNISKFILWGDLRSDSYVQNTSLTGGITTRERYRKIIEAQPDTTMDCFDWGGVYSAIVFCNKVLAKGEEVLKNDAQFASSEWQAMKAEVIGLRALNYFYLLRAFKDIPFTTQAITSDADVKIYPLVNQLTVLDTLIADVESVKGKARNRFTTKHDTKGLITNTALYALLSDMYLWRSALREGRNKDSVWWEDDARKAIEYSQKSIDELARQENQAAASYGASVSKTEDYNLGASYQIYNCNMIANPDLTQNYNNKQPTVNVPSYKAIFGGDGKDSGNSSESIFEMQYSQEDNRSNSAPGSYWDYRSEVSQLSVSKNAILQIYGSNEKKMAEDSRTWYSCNSWVTSENSEKTAPGMMKYFNCNFQLNNGRIYTAPQSTPYANWIFYRLTDVMLIQAEAYALLNTNDGFKKCRAIVDAIHKRSTVGEVAAEFSGSTRDQYIKLVMNERQIELLGEGKRWFDLVRWAERKGGGTNPDPREPQYTDGAEGVKLMVKEFMNNTYSSMESTLTNRIKNRYGLYCPIYEKERQASEYKIDQNPVWNREKES